MTDVLTPEAALSALSACYEGMDDKLAVENRKWNIRDSFAGLIGDGPAKRGRAAMMNQLYTDVGACMKDLLTALEPCPEEERSRWAIQALELMLFSPPAKDKNLSLMVSALEWLAEPLVHLADTKALADIAKRYQARNPKRTMFPNQVKLLAAMKTRAGL